MIPLNGVGPTVGKSTKQLIEERDVDLSKDLARLHAAENKLKSLGYEYKKGKWV